MTQCRLAVATKNKTAASGESRNTSNRPIKKGNTYGNDVNIKWHSKRNG